MIEELKFTGEVKGQRCAICKLALDKRDEVLACFHCGSMFHKEHLFGWLIEIPECPVCTEDFSGIVEKYRAVIYEEADESIIGKLQEQPSFVITNENPVNVIVLRIVLTIVGLIVALGPNIAISLPFPWMNISQFDPIVIFVGGFSMLMTVIFTFGGIVVIYYGSKKTKKDITNLWRHIILRQDKMVITSGKVPNVEFWPEDITRIELKTATKRSETTSITRYSVVFRVITRKNKIYDFGNIYTSIDSSRTRDIYLQLKNKIRENYGITTDSRSSSTFLKELVSKPWRLIVIVLAIHVITSIVCIVIRPYIF